MASLRRSKSLSPDGQTARFLYTIIKQLDLKTVDWNEVASGLEITNGHAARMRFSRFKQQVEGTASQPRAPRGKKAVGNVEKATNGKGREKGMGGKIIEGKMGLWLKGDERAEEDGDGDVKMQDLGESTSNVKQEVGSAAVTVKREHQAASQIDEESAPSIKHEPGLQVMNTFLEPATFNPIQIKSESGLREPQIDGAHMANVKLEPGINTSASTSNPSNLNISKSIRHSNLNPSLSPNPTAAAIAALSLNPRPQPAFHYNTNPSHSFPNTTLSFSTPMPVYHHPRPSLRPHQPSPSPGPNPASIPRSLPHPLPQAPHATVSLADLRLPPQPHSQPTDYTSKSITPRPISQLPLPPFKYQLGAPIPRLALEFDFNAPIVPSYFNNLNMNAKADSAPVEMAGLAMMGGLEIFRPVGVKMKGGGVGTNI